MTEPHSSTFDLVVKLRELGATKISVGDVHVEFGTPFVPANAQPFERLFEPQVDDEEAQRKAWEELNYFSAGG